MNQKIYTKKQRIQIMIPLLLGGFIALLNETLLNVAFPQLTATLHVSTSTIQWLATAYMLIIGISVPVIAFLLENITTKKLYLFAMLIFFIGSICCGFSQSFEMLLISRMIQGVGTGMLIPIMMYTILAIFPPEQRGSAIGLSLIVVVVAPAIGPTLSGLVLQYLDWHWLFFATLPLSLLAIILGMFSLINVSNLSKPKIDIVSILLSTVGFGGLIFGICSIETMGFFNGTVMIALFAGIAGVAFFVIRQLSLKQPMIEMRAFRYPMFSLSTCILLIAFMIPFSINIILPTYLQNILGLSPSAAGLALLPGGILCGFITPLSGKLFDKIGAKPLVLSGFFILTGTMFMLSRITASTNLTMLIILHCFTFVGTSLINTPIQTNALNQLPKEYNAHGVAITNTIQQLAAAFGSSLFIGLMGARQTAYLSKLTNPSIHQQQNAMILGVKEAFTAALIMVIAALILTFSIKGNRENIPSEVLEN
jgi:drug resistance transporter, EmrB/QacA subfamily